MQNMIMWDLHNHTNVSDGTVAPEARIPQIIELDPNNQGFWAVSDHDRLNPKFVECARAEWIKAIWATEISAHSDEIGLSLHMTCYLPQYSEKVAKILAGIIEGRKAKVLWQTQKLRESWFHIDDSWFFEWIQSQGMSIDSATNWHIAQYIWQNKENRWRVKDLTNNVIQDKEWIQWQMVFMKECLRDNGDFAELGYFRTPRYEPEISRLVEIVKKEDGILSVAHPNFSFTKHLNNSYGTNSRESRIEAFADSIVPKLSEVWVFNYEINALASSEWVQIIANTVQKTRWVITYGSDNHWDSVSNSKHGIFWVQNPLLTDDMIRQLKVVLHSFI